MFDSTMQLLLACARPTAGPEQSQRVRELLREHIDWDLFLERAAWHCVGPLVYTALRSQASDSAPNSVLESLRSLYERNFRRNLFLSGRMVQMVRKFREQSIPAIAFKGLVLCTFYQDLALREFDDLDFLVAPDDVSKANELLLEEGFRPLLYKPCVHETRTLPFARAFSYEMAYASPDGSCKVDLHWALMPGFWALPAQIEEVWDRLQTLPVAGGSVTTLSYEDTLLLLCAHGAKHMWQSLGWICDVAALLNAVPNLNWNEVSSRAEKFRVRRALGLGLHLAVDLLGVTVPAEMVPQIYQDVEVKKLAATVEKQLLAGNSTPENVLASCSFLMRSRENLRDAFRCGFDRIFRPTMAEWQSVALPQILFPVYYFLRPVRLFTKHGLRD